MDHIKKKILKKISFWALKWSQHPVSRHISLGRDFSSGSTGLWPSYLISPGVHFFLDSVKFLEKSNHMYNLLLTVPWTYSGTSRRKEPGEEKTNPSLVWIAWGLLPGVVQETGNKNGVGWGPCEAGVLGGWSVRCGGKGFRGKEAQNKTEAPGVRPGQNPCFFFFLIFWLCGMQGLSSLTRDWVHVPNIGSAQS